MNWQKSSFCSTDHVTEQCVEVTSTLGSKIVLRDTQFDGWHDISHNEMVTDRQSFAKFIEGVKAGEFDQYLPGHQK